MLRKTILLTVLAFCFVSYKVSAQDKDNAEKLTVKIGGYIRTEMLYDTRRSTETRDGESYSYPLKKGLDAAGKDTNQFNQFGMLGIQSRFKISANGLSAFGAKVGGFLEADFLGMNDDTKFLVGLRHAYMKLDWDKNQLLIGQYWAPMSIPEFAANTVLFASGTTFQPSIRSVQARFTHKTVSSLKLSLIMLGYSTSRPAEPKYNNTQRNAGIPAFNAQLIYGDMNGLYFAYTVGYRFLKPYLETTVTSGGITSKYKSDKTVGSYEMQVCLGYQYPNLSLKWQGNYGENMTQGGLIGGYLPVDGTQNSQSIDYTNMTTISTWFDIETKGTKFRPGLFVGYSENLGTSKDAYFDKRFSTDLCRGSDIRKLYRIAPRFYYISGPVDIGVEYMASGAAYGTFSKQSVKGTQTPVVNNRFLVSVRYTF